MLFVIGGMIAMTQMAELRDTPLYLAVTFFLSLTAVLFAAILVARPDLFRIVFLAWTLAAMVTGLLGILGYFGLTGGRFTLYDRAAGAFKDPNVFGPYLVLPATYLFHRLMTGNPLKMPLYVGALLFLSLAILLSFSRGAWGLYFFALATVTAALFIQSTSGAFRLRIAVMAVVAMLTIGIAAMVVLQIPAIADLFVQRAQLVQDYDGARLGRFARYTIGFQLAMERPLGIGALVFGRMYGEDTHNIWLKTLLDYSWLGFAAYLTLIVWTIAGGFRILFRDRPWQPFLLCAYAVFIGHVLLGTVIDTNHWRHFYILLGVIWGAIAPSPWRRRDSPKVSRQQKSRRSPGGFSFWSGFSPYSTGLPVTSEISATGASAAACLRRSSMMSSSRAVAMRRICAMVPPVPAGMRRPTMTFSFRPCSVSTLPPPKPR
jgi:O-antigen ligase